MNANRMVCTGRLTKDPERRQVSSDMKGCQLRLADRSLVDASLPIYERLSQVSMDECRRAGQRVRRYGSDLDGQRHP
jgi:hypothetical protein